MDGDARFSVTALFLTGPARGGDPGVPEVAVAAKLVKDPSQLRDGWRGGHAPAPGTRARLLWVWGYFAAELGHVPMTEFCS